MMCMCLCIFGMFVLMCSVYGCASLVFFVGLVCAQLWGVVFWVMVICDICFGEIIFLDVRHLYDDKKCEECMGVVVAKFRNLFFISTCVSLLVCVGVEVLLSCLLMSLELSVLLISLSKL